MQILSDRKRLARQIKANADWYNYEAKYHHQGTLSKTWLKYVAKLSPDQWQKLCHADTTLPITIYQRTLRLLQDMEESVLGKSYHPRQMVHQPHKITKSSEARSSVSQAKQNMQKVLTSIRQKMPQDSQLKSKNYSIDHAKRNLQRVLRPLNQPRSKTKRVITLIKAQKRQRNRFNVYVNGHYAFPAGINELTRYHLRIGMPISRSLQKTISESSNVSKMFNRASTRIIHHLQTEHEIRKWLHQKYACSIADVNKVVQQLKSYHLIDDVHYSHEYIRAEIVSGSKGPEAIARHLRTKGIDSLTVHNALSRFYPLGKQLIIAKRRAKDKFKMQSHTPFAKRVRKIKLSLVRKGFNFDVANQAVDECHFQPNHEQQKRLLIKYTHQAFRRYGRKLRRDNYYQINMKIKRFLFRKGFDFDAVDQAVEIYKQTH